MASDGANEHEEPYASEYAEKGSPNDRDYDEGTNVEHNAKDVAYAKRNETRDTHSGRA